MGLFSGKRAPPPRVPTDEVQPVHFFDDLDSYRGLVMCWTLVFEDVLDAEKLRDALARLLETGEWRRLGGRLRLNDAGKLEVHVPEKFTPSRPSSAFSHETFDTPIASHPLASRLPTPSEGPSIQDSADPLKPLTVASDVPRTLDDYLYTDAPQLSIRVVNFSDATLVAVQWPHVLGDALSLRCLVRNWSKVLAGREDEVEPLLGAREDPLADVGAGPKPAEEEPWVLADKALKRFGFFIFVVNFIWALVFGSKMEVKSICLPATTVAKLREGAIRDLADKADGDTAGDSDDKPKPPFISENDVVTAWATKMACLTIPTSRPVGVLNVFEARSRLPGALSTAACVSNIVFPSWTLLAPGEIASAPLGKTALTLRRSLASQITEGQIRAQLRAMRESIATLKRPPLVLEPRAEMVTFSSWEKAKLFEAVDFSPAIVKIGKAEGSPGRMSRPGGPRFHYSALVNENKTLRNVFNVVGKDPAGNFWLLGILPRRTWQLLEKEMRTM
ncbi:Transferase family domain-containing protein [Pleurostoma richardsiae]|uniref:Transferase family domain-containing protein n=1 Tax=Pleurostoma richardsiae TaxID=41990 RepID=A0AA38VJZ3_9PEZI|nr:Transferase family domain-containing protein [Pleurostoma richardsiae]